MRTVITSSVERLERDEIENVFIKELESARYAPQYGERPSRYMVQLRGEKRKRRVYAAPIGNVAVLYIKTGGKLVFCEMSLDLALYRKEHG